MTSRVGLGLRVEGRPDQFSKSSMLLLVPVVLSPALRTARIMAAAAYVDWKTAVCRFLGGRKAVVRPLLVRRRPAHSARRSLIGAISFKPIDF